LESLETEQSISKEKKKNHQREENMKDQSKIIEQHLHKEKKGNFKHYNAIIKTTLCTQQKSISNPIILTERNNS
jgi:hypothetical protein